MNGAPNNPGVPKAEGGTPKTSGLSNRKDHSQNDLNLPDIPRSGRWGEWVYYVRSNKQCRRRYVVPRDPRTPNQLRCRAALTAASKAWSHSPALMPEDRQAWIAAAAKLRTRVRLNQSGTLTGQQHFVGWTCAKPRPTPELQVRPKATRRTPLIPHSAFFLLPSALISFPTPAQPRHSPHVDHLRPRAWPRSGIRSFGPLMQRRRSEIRCSAHRRDLWRGS
jgi:hypothetical protein